MHPYYKTGRHCFQIEGTGAGILKVKFLTYELKTVSKYIREISHTHNIKSPTYNIETTFTHTKKLNL